MYTDTPAINELFVPSTNGLFSGAVDGQAPILRYHPTDGDSYSDFARVVFVGVDGGYAANSYKSHADVQASNATLTASDLMVNAPVVPLNATLQHPIDPELTAPVASAEAWYRGTTVRHFVFETNSEDVAEAFAATREDPEDERFRIEVVSDMFSPDTDGVADIPIWHFNQYSDGVVAGVTSGGPWSEGQRNVIDTDRGDAGYSALWSVLWVSQLPIDYRPSSAFEASLITTDNGFQVDSTSMMVNCPTLGVPGGSSVAQDPPQFGISRM